MLTLLHFPLSPFCRKVRSVLAEKKIDAKLVETAPWALEGRERTMFAAVQPSVCVPVLTVDETALGESAAIVEYLEEAAGGRRLMPDAPLARAEARRLAAWADHQFYIDVSGPILTERILKKLKRGGPPVTEVLRGAAARLETHLAHLSKLKETRRWLAGDELTIADFAMAAHISVLDYTGDASFEGHPHLQHWYALMKSRDSFAAIFRDRLAGMPPSRDYAAAS